MVSGEAGDLRRDGAPQEFPPPPPPPPPIHTGDTPPHSTHPPF